MFVGAGHGQRFADGAAALADDGFQTHAVERESHGIGGVADRGTENGDVLVAARTARQSAEHRRAGESCAPFTQPRVGVEAEGVGEGKPGVCRGAGRLAPESFTVGGFDLRLRQRDGADVCFRKMQEEERKALRHLRLARGADQSRSGATAQSGGVTVDGDDFLELGQMIHVAGGNKGEGQCRRGAQFGAQLLRRGADPALVEFGEDQTGSGGIHAAKMRAGRRVVNRPGLKRPFDRKLRGIARSMICV